MRIIYQNPFIVGNYYAAKYFCDRNNETEALCQSLLNGQNVVLLSSLRMGKTGLIRHCLNQSALKRDYCPFFIDIYATGNLRELVFLLGKQVFETLRQEGKKALSAFFDAVPSLKAALKTAPQSRTPLFDLGIGEISHPEQTLEQIFRFLETLEKPGIIIIDEFQQIFQYAEPRVDELLSTLIRQHPHIRFILSGSRRHTLQNVLFSPSNPLYQNATLLNLAPIPKKKYIAFIHRHFREAGKDISPEQIGRVYEFFEGHTWYMQCYFNRLFTLLPTATPPTDELMQDCLTHIISLYESMFQGILFRLSDRQKELLYAIAREGKAKEIMSTAFIKKYTLLSPSSVQTSARQLLEKDFIDTDNHVYQIANRFFGLWLSREYGRGYRI